MSTGNVWGGIGHGENVAENVWGNCTEVFLEGMFGLHAGLRYKSLCAAHYQGISTET